MGVTETAVTEEYIDSMEQFRQPDKDKGLIENCAENVVVFAEYMLGMRLYSWQVDFLSRIQESMLSKDSEKEFLAITSRQIGKSTAIAVLSTWAAVFNKYPGTLSENTSVLISSASDVQAKKLLYEMKKLLKLGDRFMRDKYQNDNGEPLFGEAFFTELLDEHEPNNTQTITFKPWREDLHGEYLLKGSKAGIIVICDP